MLSILWGSGLLTNTLIANSFLPTFWKSQVRGETPKNWRTPQPAIRVWQQTRYNICYKICLFRLIFLTLEELRSANIISCFNEDKGKYHAMKEVSDEYHRNIPKSGKNMVSLYTSPADCTGGNSVAGHRLKLSDSHMQADVIVCWQRNTLNLARPPGSQAMLCVTHRSPAQSPVHVMIDSKLRHRKRRLTHDC